MFAKKEQEKNRVIFAIKLMCHKKDEYDMAVIKVCTKIIGSNSQPLFPVLARGGY